MRITGIPCITGPAWPTGWRTIWWRQSMARCRRIFGCWRVAVETALRYVKDRVRSRRHRWVSSDCKEAAVHEIGNDGESGAIVKSVGATRAPRQYGHDGTPI